MADLKLSIIVAVDEHNGIGKGGTLPWSLSADLKHFKEITTKTDSLKKQNAVIMGRKTWESLPEKFRPLPQRLNIVLTRHKDLDVPQGVLVTQSFEKCLLLIKEAYRSGRIEKAFVIGGGKVFQRALKEPLCQRIYLTKILADFQCDTFFPEFKDHFHQAIFSPQHQDNSLSYSFTEYLRKGF